MELEHPNVGDPTVDARVAIEIGEELGSVALPGGGRVSPHLGAAAVSVSPVILALGRPVAVTAERLETVAPRPAWWEALDREMDARGAAAGAAFRGRCRHGITVRQRRKEKTRS